MDLLTDALVDMTATVAALPSLTEAHPQSDADPTTDAQFSAASDTSASAAVGGDAADEGAGAAGEEDGGDATGAAAPQGAAAAAAATSAVARPAAPSAASWMAGLFGSLFGCMGTTTAAPAAADADSLPRDLEVDFAELDELKWLGAGASGCVFMARYRGEIVAVKKLKDLNMTLREFHTLQSLSHPHILSLLGISTAHPTYALIMEYCPLSLHSVISDNRIPPPLILTWASQIASGMAYLHSRNIVHRDLKSPNILLATNDTLKISDFGTARHHSNSSTKYTFAGTPAWTAPEIIRNEPCSDKVDVWSFGVVLWELLTNELPYRGVETGAIVWGVGSRSLSLPIPSTAPDGFVVLLKLCFNHNPAHRPRFEQCCLHLDILANDTNFAATPQDSYFALQSAWKEEIRLKFEAMRKLEANHRSQHNDLIQRREEELRQVQDISRVYRARLERTTSLLKQLSDYEAGLKEKEKELARRERDLELSEALLSGASAGVHPVVTPPPPRRARRLRRLRLRQDSTASSSAAAEDLSPDGLSPLRRSLASRLARPVPGHRRTASAGSHRSATSATDSAFCEPPDQTGAGDGGEESSAYEDISDDEGEEVDEQGHVVVLATPRQRQLRRSASIEFWDKKSKILPAAEVEVQRELGECGGGALPVLPSSAEMLARGDVFSVDV